MAEEEIGVVTHYFGHIMVAGLKLERGSLKVGDTIRFHGHTTDFAQKVESVQVDNVSVVEAKPGEEIGIKVTDKVRAHDKVYKVTED